MGRDQRGHPGLAHEVQELLEHVLGGLRVEVAGRLVGEKEPRPVGEGAGDGGALLLAAGKLRRTMIDAFGNAERVRSCLRALLGLGPDSPRISCGITTFSSAENSGSS